MTQIVPLNNNTVIDVVTYAVNKYSMNKPLLNWESTGDIRNSGWKTFHGKHTNICFCDETAVYNYMWFIIEFPIPALFTTRNLVASYLLFKKNTETGLVDLIYRIKPFDGNERQIIYHDCTYFGINYHYNSNDYDFIISNEVQDKALFAGIDLLKKHADFKYIVETVNNFIQHSIIHAHAIPEAMHAYPLLRVLNKFNLPLNTRANNIYNNCILLHETHGQNSANLNISDRSDDSSIYPLFSNLHINRIRTAEVISHVDITDTILPQEHLAQATLLTQNNNVEFIMSERNRFT